MTGAAVFARKELREIWRTWRIWVLPAIVFFFAVTGPFLAKYTPELVGALAGNQLRGLKVPTPTYSDAYAQWIKNLSQIVLIAVVIVYGNLISGEARSGTAMLVLTKPLSRAAFIVVKTAVHSVFLAVLIAAGAVLTWLLTLLLFGTAPASALWTSTGAFVVLGLLFMSVMTLLSVLIRSAAGAAGAGLGVYVVLSVAAIWTPLGDYSPAALTKQPASLALGQHVDVLWPIATSLVLGIGLVIAAVFAFRQQDL